MSSVDQLPPALRQHCQLKKSSCAVSAFECIGKLHGRIAAGSFLWQKDANNQKKGFDDYKEFLPAIELEGYADFYEVQYAVTLIETEVRAGRFPLVSLLQGIQHAEKARHLLYHVFLCVDYKNQLLLVNPATPHVEVKGRGGLVNRFDHERRNNPKRQDIHVMTYKALNGK